MGTYPQFQEIDYLIIGHLTEDITPEGRRSGGTAAYASLLVSRLGLRVGLVTAWNRELPTELSETIQIKQVPAERNTTFQSNHLTSRRQLIMRHTGPGLLYDHIPVPWRGADIVHLGPVVHELEEDLPGKFPHARLGITPQGWFREWDETGLIHPRPIHEISNLCSRADVVIISEEDVQDPVHDPEKLAEQISLLIVTRGFQGASIYTRGTVRQISAADVVEIDPTGAGDIFAAGFFAHFFQNQDIDRAAQFATRLAVQSVTRKGLDGVPTRDEIFAIQKVY